MPVPADKIVLTSAIVTVSSTTAKSVLPSKYGGNGHLPSAKLVIGTMLTFTGLSMASDFVPQITGPLAAAIAITALTAYGIPVLDAYMNEKPSNKKGH